MQVDIGWERLRVVGAVARAKSIRAAAGRLQITESTISRQIRAVETRLNVDLFERTPAGVVPTSACVELLSYLVRAESEIEAGIAAARGVQSRPEGTVRVTSVPTLVTNLLAPAATIMLELYPELEIDFIGLPTDLSMMQREADIAIRLARPSADLDAKTRKIGHLVYAAYALEGVDGSLLPWATYVEPMSHLPQAKWITDHTRQTGEKVLSLRCNDADGLIALIKSGCAKTLLPTIVADRIPEMVRLQEYGDLPNREVWMMVHPNLVNARRIQVVVDWIEQLFADT